MGLPEDMKRVQWTLNAQEKLNESFVRLNGKLISAHQRAALVVIALGFALFLLCVSNIMLWARVLSEAK